jgi:glycosyltransferase involved in cell wall biosynthesis
MTAEPLVSVIMSVFNGEQYLKSSVDSILEQTYSNIEFIIVNDGSSDGTFSILQGYTDPRVKRVDQTENIGLTRSLNHAIRECNGDFIARQDSDDISERGRLRAQLDYLGTHPGTAAVGTWALQIDEDGDEIGLLKRETGTAAIASRMAEENQFHHGSAMFRRSALEIVGGYREHFKYAQDYDLFLRLALKFDLANLPTPMYRKRHTQDAVSIVHSSQQKYYSDLALKLYRQRAEFGRDDLDKGEVMAALPVNTAAMPGAYEKNLVYMYLRSDKHRKARPYILNSIKATPLNLKYYLQYGLTFLSVDLRRRLFKLRGRNDG